MKPFLLALRLAVLIPPLLTGCKPPAAGGGPGGRGAGAMMIPVVTTEVKRQPITEKITLIGSLAANEAVEIKSEMDGTVQKIGFDEGTTVAKDQLLVALDDTKLAAALAETEANFKLSEATHARSQQLLADKLISPQEFDQAMATFERYRATVDLMRRQLKDARIYAPFEGVTGARLVSPGQVISRNTILTTLVDADPVKVEFYVPERFLRQVEVGQTLEISVAAYPGRTFAGQVYFVAPQLETETRKVLVKARIDNPKQELKPGMFATLELTLHLRENAIVIPEIALMWDNDSARVFVVDASQTATVRPVQLGLRLPGQTEILSGLEPGEKIIVEGTQKVAPGAKVATGPPAATPGAAGAVPPAGAIPPTNPPAR